jgi:class 3 adenylate cyclase
VGHEWWIFAATCAAIAYALLRLHRRRRRRLAVVNRFENDVTPELVKRVLAEPPAAPALREISILSTNLTGYVPFCEIAGDHEAVAAINRHRALLVPVVRRHHGVIAEFLGDGTICLFGAPKPDPDHAANAVAAALELSRAHESLLNELRSRGLPDLSLRLGIATGRVIVGDIGQAYGAAGAAVNEATLLQSACKALDTGLLISPRTAERIAGTLALRRVSLPSPSPQDAFAFQVPTGVVTSPTLPL